MPRPDTGPATIVVDDISSVVRAVDTVTGRQVVVAGTGAAGFEGDGGPATAARLDHPAGVVVDRSRNILIADTLNDRVRRVDAITGLITTVAGGGSVAGDGGPATSAVLERPTGLAVDGSGNLYIADTGDARVRRVDVGTGVITTVAGTGHLGDSGDGGPATSAGLDCSGGLAIDTKGNLFIGDSGGARVRRVDSATGIITAAAGDGTSGFGGDGGPAPAARLAWPAAIALDGAGNLYIADRGNHRIRRVDAATGTITTVAGGGQQGASVNGVAATAAALDQPVSVVVDPAGNVFFADSGDLVVRRIDVATHSVVTVLGDDVVVTHALPHPTVLMPHPTVATRGSPKSGACAPCPHVPGSSATAPTSVPAGATTQSKNADPLVDLIRGLDRDLARAQAVGEYVAARADAASLGDGGPAQTISDPALVEAAADQLRATATLHDAERRSDESRRRLAQVAVTLYVGEKVHSAPAVAESLQGERSALLAGIMEDQQRLARQAARDLTTARSAAALTNARVARLIQARATAIPSPALPSRTTTPPSSAGSSGSVAAGASPIALSPTILGPSVLSADELAGWFLTSGHQADLMVSMATLAGDYETLGAASGVRGDLAFAQSILETAYFSFPTNGQVSKGDNNFAGIGACDSCATGFHFPDASTGVAAQMQLLHQYASTSEWLSGPLPMRVAVSGCCPTWLALTGVWATDNTYGMQILQLYRSMVDWALARRQAAATA